MVEERGEVMAEERAEGREEERAGEREEGGVRLTRWACPKSTRARTHIGICTRSGIPRHPLMMERI